MTVKNPLPKKYVKEWHPSLNGALLPENVSSGSNKNVWWLGKECGHEWDALIKNRVSKGQNCLICSGRRLMPGINDLATLNPLLAAEWHPTLNGNLTPKDVHKSANRRAWWLGKCGHEWNAVINMRVGQSQGCPVCAGKKVVSGFNDLQTVCPELANEWHPTLNGALLPNAVSKGSNKRVWWLGKCGHEWDAQINNRVSLRRGCPVCSGQKIISGINDLETLNPQIAASWNYLKNTNVSPAQISLKSNKSVWWVDALGHEWRTSVANRVSGKNCPFCSGNHVFAGLNDLKSQAPELAKQWHPMKNLIADVSTINMNSQKKAWWLCPKNHEWESRINHRVNGVGCPTCSASIYVSKPEKALAEFIRSLGFHIDTSARSVIKGGELDIYIPSLKIAIEYNGLYWHSERTGKMRTYHQDKWNACKKLGIQLIQIWEDEYQKNPILVHTMLAHKLGKSIVQKVSARNTTVSVLDTAMARDFMNAYHIEGFSSGSYYLGLKDKKDGSIVAVLVLKKDVNDTFKIARYATSKIVVGGFTKLLRYSENEYAPQRFIALSDHCVSDGSLYSSNGFVVDKEFAPDYRYVAKGKRVNKSGYHLKRFRDDSNLIWEEGKTEKELAEINNLSRIWDAGKTRWVKTVHP